MEKIAGLLLASAGQRDCHRNAVLNVQSPGLSRVELHLPHEQGAELIRRGLRLAPHEIDVVSRFAVSRDETVAQHPVFRVVGGDWPAVPRELRIDGESSLHLDRLAGQVLEDELARVLRTIHARHGSIEKKRTPSGNDQDIDGDKLDRLATYLAQVLSAAIKHSSVRQRRRSAHRKNRRRRKRDSGGSGADSQSQLHSKSSTQ